MIWIYSSDSSVGQRSRHLEEVVTVGPNSYTTHNQMCTYITGKVSNQGTGGGGLRILRFTIVLAPLVNEFLCLWSVSRLRVLRTIQYAKLERERKIPLYGCYWSEYKIILLKSYNIFLETQTYMYCLSRSFLTNHTKKTHEFDNILFHSKPWIWITIELHLNEIKQQSVHTICVKW